MDLTKKIEPVQKWNNEPICFDPDSSPEAWDFCRAVYKGISPFDEYELDDLVFYTTVKDDISLYCSHPLPDHPNRLFALKKGTEKDVKNGIRYFKASERLSGDTVFNFKSNIYDELLKNDEEAMSQLENCRKTHHTLVNFSLMQSMGELQQFKKNGLWLKNENKYEGLDRFDSFLYLMNKYYIYNNNSSLGRYISYKKENGKALSDYLNKFKDIYDYCGKTYFIDEELVNELIENGGNTMNDDVAEKYIGLAEKFWKKRKIIFGGY